MPLAIVVLLLAASACAQAAPGDYRVRLFWLHPPSELTLIPRGSVNCNGSPLAAPLLLRASADSVQSNQPRCSGQVVKISEAIALKLSNGAAEFSHPLEIRSRRGRLLVTGTISLEQYVASVLLGESSVFTSAEALKAMAVAVRTYAVHYRGRHRAEGFDLCDTTHCQDLRIAEAPPSRLISAVEATEGELLWYGGAPAATYYHRHCGGSTEDVESVWPDRHAPYLKRQTDTFCLSRGRAPWRSEVLGGSLGPGPPPRILSRTASGRVAELDWNGRRITATRFHQRIGEMFGWTTLRSNHYDVAQRGEHIVFQGFGAGHGVGLCQAGTEERGKAGSTYRQILAFYYPGTKLGINAQGFAWVQGRGELVDVAAESGHTAADLAALADRALREAQRRTGLPLAFRPILRSYPSVAGFRDATGQPGWVAASTRGTVVRMQPIALLRSLGTLEAVLLHESLHLLIESNAHPSLPEWFREGLALCLSDSDAALQQRGRAATKAEASHRAAHRQAKERVERLLQRFGRQRVLGWVRSGLPGEALHPAGK
ncbi:MAG: SpoIID/LytB domain-containing protein [Bryobacteraceae bacterium]|nr:SpoIID/LytB domain-containing protein [Bryobacteraceae bacterium]